MLYTNLHRKRGHVVFISFSGTYQFISCNKHGSKAISKNNNFKEKDHLQDVDVKIILKFILSEGADWICLAQDKGERKTNVNMVIGMIKC
jgi:hypothetical protein